MRSLGFEVKKAEVVQLLAEHDPTECGSIGYGEFLEIMTKRYAERSPEEELKKAFELFDEARTPHGRAHRPPSRPLTTLTSLRPRTRAAASRSGTCGESPRSSART